MKTMKKIYLNPELQVVKIKVNHQLLTLSAGGEEGSGTVSDTFAPEDGEGEGRGGFFDED
jgi:hypothetical protein